MIHVNNKLGSNKEKNKRVFLAIQLYYISKFVFQNTTILKKGGIICTLIFFFLLLIYFFDLMHPHITCPLYYNIFYFVALLFFYTLIKQCLYVN